MFQPGSVNSGGTWQLAQPALPLKTRLRAPRPPRRSCLPAAAGAGMAELVEMQGGELGGDEIRLAAHVAEAVRRGDGELVASFSRGSKNVPLPCISRLATKAFQCVTEPQPVQVCRFTPARPKAGGISVAAARRPDGTPCRRGSARRRTCPAPSCAAPAAPSPRPRRAVGERLQFGASAMIAPTSRSRLAQPSQPAADARRERVVHGRVAQRAVNADRPSCLASSKKPVRRRPRSA